MPKSDFSSRIGNPLAITRVILVIKGAQKVIEPEDHSVLRKESNMLWTIAVILLVLWLLGFLGGYAGGGLIHLLLVIGIVVVVIQVIQGRR
jgi:hypothetical protein